jgi:leucyl/phenylalanyl-tRNA--protein transferase
LQHGRLFTRGAGGASQPAPGLLAAGGALDVPTLRARLRGGIFPWFSDGQPILWWSTDPRMVLFTAEFRCTARCARRWHRLRCRPAARCASTRLRRGDPRLRRQPARRPVGHLDRAGHGAGLRRRSTRAGHAHSVETWIDGELAGGLYCVNVGRAVFGESMFTRVPDASKIALAALVAFCRAHRRRVIDCQQNTRHLASLGAREIPRADFVAACGRKRRQAGAAWRFEPVYWRELLLPNPTSAA